MEKRFLCWNSKGMARIWQAVTAQRDSEQLAYFNSTLEWKIFLLCK